MNEECWRLLISMGVVVYTYTNFSFHNTLPVNHINHILLNYAADYSGRAVIFFFKLI
jgi:hypothetical protein